MNTRSLLITAVVGASVLTAWGPSAAFGQCEITPVTAGDNPVAKQKFGWSTAISGDYAVVGTDEPSSSTGAAYIYERDGLEWNEIGRLVPTPELNNDDEYGRAVAISGRVAVVGARKHDIAGMTERGAVYVFRRDSQTGVWGYRQELTAEDGDVGDLFGSSVAIDGDWIVVGAPEHDVFGVDNSGAAYAFHFDGSTWTQARKFRADDHDEADQFGIAVAISGNWVVVGSKWDDDGCPGEQEDLAKSGSAYTFFHDPAAASNVGWEPRTKLQAQIVDGATVSCDAGFSDNFGFTVAISGDRLVVGAIFDSDDGSSSGSAYVYRLEEPDWVIEQKLTASDGAERDNFGRAVAIHGDLVLVGAPKGDLDDPPIADTGSAYLYRRAGTEWIDEVELTAKDWEGGDRFGQFVSMSGDYAAIGAYKKNDSTGSAYIFAVGTASDCNDNGVHDDCEILVDPDGLDPNGNGILESCECTTDESCNEDVLSCISGTCDQDSNLCVFTVDPGFCAIAGACFDDGALNPANNCQLCNAAAGDSDWSNGDEGLSCGILPDTICDHPDTCDGEGLCRTNPEPAGTACPDDGNECTDDLCDGAGACSHPPKANGTDCADDGNECTDDECDGAGDCSHPPEATGTACGDQTPDTECNPADTCDGDGTCLDNVKDDDTPCFHDGLFCTGEDSCQGGVCQSAGDPCTAEGLLCDDNAEAFDECSCDPAVDGACDDGVFCTGVEICDAGRCFSPGDPCIGQGQFCEEVGGRCVECRDVADCIDDGNDCTETVCRDGDCEDDALDDDTPCGSGLDDECTNPDTCASGVCDANDEPVMTACGDPSDTECDPADTCDGAGTCADNILSDGTTCADDGVFCTGPESCQGGDCTSEGDPCTAPGLICDDVAELNVACSCDGDAACDDGVFCNGSETCGATGSCEDGTSPCDASLVCDEFNEICQCDDNDDCAEDGLFCNGEEICFGGACIHAGDPCPPTVTTPVCREATDSCECDSDDHCDDGNECTDDVCDGAGICLHSSVADGTACTQDGVFCNGAEICNAGECISPGDPCAADESCNERGKKCLECETGDDDACNDDDNCTVDRCPFGMCMHETLPECKDDDDDGVINSQDQCPGTPEDAQVDAIGCTCADAIDTDHDGVIDCNDDCADTPLNESADNSGCSCSQPFVDSDEDGVANACDDCLGTPSGEAVDETGCAQSQIDSDQDGVMNDVDDCPGSPTGIEVGDDGCPLPVDNANDNEPGQDVPNDNGNDNDNTGDNDNDNTSDNDNGSTGDEPASRPCGFFGMINLAFLGLGMIAMRVTRSRHRRSRR